MKKRVFSAFMAAVVLVTALFAMPAPQKTEAYSNAQTNDTWNSSYHALSEDAGTAEKPGYVGKYTHTVEVNPNGPYDKPTGFDEYNMPDQFAVISYNDCEALTDIDTGETLFTDECTPQMVDCTVEGSVGAITNNLHGNMGSNAYVMKMRTNYTNGYQAPQNVIGTVKNANDFDVTNFQYFRFHVFCQNVQIQNGGYCRVQLHTASGITQWDITSEVAVNKTNNFLFDVTNVTGEIEKIQIHCAGIRRVSNDTTTARMILDNFRFIRNTTYSDTYAYTPTYKEFKFHGCDNESDINSTIKQVNYNNYTATKHLGITHASGSIVSGNGSFVFGPNGNGSNYNHKEWYQVAFLNSTGVKPSDYGYLRFYLHVGKLFKTGLSSDKITVYLNPTYDYSTNTSQVKTRGNIVLSNSYTPNNGWYMITVNVQDIDVVIKSISIQFGELNVPSPSGSLHDEAKVHIDEIQFFGYDYQPNTKYPYLAGHYKILDGFETGGWDQYNSSSISHAVSHQAYNLEPQYKGDVDGWASKRGTTEAHPETGLNMTGAGFPHTVTQGRYAMMWRPNIHDNTEDSWVKRTFSTTVDLSKFSHISLDFTIRDMQRATAGDKYADLPGMRGNNERFVISFIDVNGNSTNLVFYLKKTSSTTEFVYSPDHLVEGFPLYGFVPGCSHQGLSYTPVGPMRLVVNMGQMMDHKAQAGFDITQVKSYTITYVRSGGDRHQTDYEYTTGDNRRCDFYIDNLVAFTPDMNLSVEVTGADSLDAGQRAVVRVNGNDAITNHVAVEYSASPYSGNGLEIINNIPLNSYVVSMEPWAWRYHQGKERIINDTSLPRYNDTWVSGYTGRSLGYRAICDNKQKYLYPTVTFNLTRYHDKWLDNNGYAVY